MTIKSDQTDLRDDLDEIDELINEFSVEYAESHIEEYGINQKMVNSISLTSVMDETQIIVAKKIIEYYEDASGKPPPSGYANRYWVGDRLNMSKRFQNADKIATSDVKKAIKEFLKNENESIALDEEIRVQIDSGFIDTDEIRADVLELIRLQEKNGFVKIPQSVKNSVLNYRELGYSSSQLGEAYKSLLDVLELGDKAKIKEAFADLVAEKTNYVARRISRTEIARAYFEGTIASYQDDDSVVGFKWNLNPKRTWSGFDICDINASVNFGMGKGVFPNDQLPTFPAHPNCACYISPVYDFELPNDPNFDFVKNGNEFIAKLPKYKQKELLGVSGSKAFKNGENWNKIVKTYGKTTIPNDSVSKILKKAQN